MPSESGFNNQKKLGLAQFKTIQPLGSDRQGTVNGTLGLTTVTSGVSLDQALISIDRKSVRLWLPGHGARKDDVIRVLNGDNAGFEIVVDSIVDTNYLNILNIVPSPFAGDGSEQVDVLRWITLALDPSGNINVAPAAGGATEAKQDDQIVIAGETNDKLDTLIAKDFSTSAKQDTGNASLSTIAAKDFATSAKQDTGNASLSTIAGKDFSTSAKQDTGNASLATIAGKDFSTSAKQDTMIAAIGAPADAAASSDTGTFSLISFIKRGLQNWTTLQAKIPALGQALMAVSFPVVIASNQSAIPTTTSVVDPTASGNITTQNLVPAGVATTNSAVEISLSGQGTVAVQVTGTYTGALSAQGTVDGTTWVTLSSLMNVNTGALLASITSALQGIFQVETAGFNKIRITGLAAVTGTATVSLRATRQASLVGLDSPIPAGSNTIGAVTVTSTTLSGSSNAVNSTRATVAGTVTQGQVAVGLSAVRCTVAGTAPSATRKRLSIKPSINNSGRIFIGASTVTTANGLEIVGPDRIDFEFDSGDYYMISDVTSQVVEVMEKA